MDRDVVRAGRKPGRRMGRGIGRYAFGLLAVLCSHFVQAQETLGVPEVFQPQGSLWCWAAVSEAVIEYYYDTDVRQCDIVNWVRTQEGWGPADCCQHPGDPDSCDRVLDNLTAYAGASVRNILRHWNVASERPGLCHPDPAPGTPPDWSCYAMPSPTPEGLQEEITRGRPFVIHRAGGGGHFMVGRGFRRDPQGGTAHLVDIMDPAFGQGYQTVRYDQLIRGGWDVTLLTDLELPWSVEKLMLAGDTAPDGSAIEEVSSNISGQVKGFDVNDDGNVVYIATMADQSEAIYTSAGEVIARSGQEAPGGGRFAAFILPGGYRYVSINDSDQVVFLAKLDDGRDGVFTATSAIRTGDPAPDGGVFAAFDGSDINDAGQIAFFAKTTVEGGTRRGLYAWDGAGSAPRLLTRAGVMGGIPVLRGDGSVVYLGSGRTDTGEAYQAVLPSDADTSGDDPYEALFAYGGGAAPGGGTFAMGPEKFNFPSATGDAPFEVAFVAELDNGEEGVFTSTRRIALVSEPAPVGGTFSNFSGTPSINNPHRVVYAADTAQGPRGVFDTHGGPVVVAGQTAVGEAPIIAPADPVLTNDGQVVFHGFVRDENGEARGGLFMARKVRMAPAP